MLTLLGRRWPRRGGVYSSGFSRGILHRWQAGGSATRHWRPVNCGSSDQRLTNPRVDGETVGSLGGKQSPSFPISWVVAAPSSSILRARLLARQRWGDAG